MRLSALSTLPRLLFGGLAALALTACSGGGFDLGTFGGNAPPTTPDNSINLPLAEGQTFGTGPVRVALLLPLTGDPALATVGTSMAHGAELAMDYIASSGAIADNITLVLKDTGPSVPGATAATAQAVAEGASLILGPLKADQVMAAGATARSSGIPMIGFSNNSGAAGPGVFLLNVLPETEVKRSMSYVKKLGKKAYAGIFSTNDYGRIQQGAFTQAASELGLNVRAVYNFSSEDEARGVVAQLAPLLQQGQIDALFIPDRATAPSFATLFEQAGVPQGQIQFIGSADWNADQNILNSPYLAGAVFPAVDDAGYNALLPQYTAKFGGTMHALATIAYTATILANSSSLALGTPKYDRAQLTIPGGFKGRDGVFRFLSDGRAEYALVIKQVTIGGSAVAEGAKL
ncbi:MAG TPA: penicillin-binding protein activator [Devosia sp.]|nr:penicillin-binding protein activator [Devosia sp.]